MEEKREIGKLGYVAASKMWELLDFLESLDENEETKKDSALIKLENFLPNIKTKDLIILKTICKDRDTDLYNSFVSKYSYIEFDSSGKSKPKNQEPWRVKLFSLEQVCSYSKQSIDAIGEDVLKHKPNKQIVNAKTLKCLKSVEFRELALTRKLFANKFNGQDLPVRLEDFEIIKNELKERIPNISKFISIVLDYCLRFSKKEDFEFFLSHVFARLDVLACDKDLEEQVNKEYLKSINNIISLNN